VLGIWASSWCKQHCVAVFDVAAEGLYVSLDNVDLIVDLIVELVDLQFACRSTDKMRRRGVQCGGRVLWSDALVPRLCCCLLSESCTD
jgi:hypothetical protein